MLWPKRFHGPVWLTAVGALLFLTIVELVKPRAFLYDDNLTQFLPWYSFSYDSWRHGVVPQIDFYNYLGHPVLTAGQAGVFYPPIFLGMALAHFCGRPAAGIEWLCWMHLAAAALVVERLTRPLFTRAAPSVALGWLYLTLPFNLCASQLWTVDSYTIFFVPLVFLCLDRLAEQPTLRRTAALALVKAFFLFSGHLNYFALCLIFEVFFLALRFGWTGLPGLRRAFFAWVGANVLGGLAAMAALGPILLHLGQTAERSQPMALDLVLSESMHLTTFFASQFGLFLTDDTDNYLFRPGWYYWGGSILLLAAPWAFWREPLVRRWGLLVLAAVVLSTSAYVLVCLLPGYRSFRWPVKNMLFGGFFYVMLFASGLRLTERRWPGLLCLGLILFGVAMNVVVALSAASLSGSEIFPRYAPEFHLPFEKLRDGRSVLVGLVNGDRFNPDYLGFEFATLARTPGFAGYDPLVLAQNKREALDIVFLGLPWQPLDDAMVRHFSDWSVRYYFVHESSPAFAFLQSRPRFHVVYQHGPLHIFQDDLARTFAFFADAPQQPLPVAFGHNELTIDTRTHRGSGTLSLSLVPLAGYSWTTSDGQGGAVPVAADGRMTIPDIPGAGTIEIRYREPGLEFFIAVSLASFALLASCLLNRKDLANPNSV